MATIRIEPCHEPWSKDPMFYRPTNEDVRAALNEVRTQGHTVTGWTKVLVGNRWHIDITVKE